MKDSVIQDEARVPDYTLPEILPRGMSAQTWPQHRETLLKLFSDTVFGHTPETGPGVVIEKMERMIAPLLIPAERIQLKVRVGPEEAGFSFDLLLYLPNTRPAPVILGLNFSGNHCVHRDPGIWLPSGWVPDWEDCPTRDHRALDQARGARARRWPVELLLERGVAMATVYAGDLAPDLPGHEHIQRFRSLFPAPQDPESEWGTIGMWAWTLSCAREILEELTEVDVDRIMLTGHSRLGKAALWAAAQDEAFAAVLSNNSGCMGAALSRRCFGETVAAITDRFPHWFCPRLAGFANRESELPIDQHHLLALIAPRPLHVASATEDLWADPHGEFLATQAAGAFYEQLGLTGLGASEMPPPGTRIGNRVGYHLRTGPHDILAEDWSHYLDSLQENGLI